MARCALTLGSTSPCWNPATPENGNNFADRSPEGMGSSHSNLCSTLLRWAPQKPPNVATVSQIAAPQGQRGLS
eukprot:3460221-Pyramimonas_sp.AAC.1